MKDYIEPFASHIRDRVFSPLSFAFLLSWLVWNYKFLLVFFSDMKPYVKFSYISGQVYPDLLTAVTVGFVWPLATSLAYVLFYPFATYGIMVVTHWHSNRIEKLRQKNEGETPMSEESAKAFRKVQNERIKTIENDLDESVERVRVLKGDAVASENKIISLIHENNAAAASAEEEIKKLSVTLEGSKVELNEVRSELDGSINKLKELTEILNEKENALSEVRSAFSDSRREFASLVSLHNETIESKASIKNELDADRVSSAAEIQQLKAVCASLRAELVSVSDRLNQSERENINLKSAAVSENKEEIKWHSLNEKYSVPSPLKRKLLIKKKPDKTLTAQPVFDDLGSENNKDINLPNKTDYSKLLKEVSETATSQQKKSTDKNFKIQSWTETLEAALKNEALNKPKKP